jgi:hypothetical protein
VVLVFALELIELAGERGIGGEQAAEGAHDVDCDGLRAIQDIGGLDGARAR